MTASKLESSPLRPIGRLEKYNIIRHHVNFYNNVQVSAKYTIPAQPNCDTAGFMSIVYSALGQTVKSHPILNVVIAEEATAEPRWERVETIDFRDHVKVIEEAPHDSLDLWITAGHRERLDRLDQLPPWRIIVATKDTDLALIDKSTLTFTLAFFAHHAISDGLSCAAFHVTFLSALNDLISDPSSISSSPLFRPAPNLTLLPTIEASTPLPLTLWFTLRNIIRAFIYSPIDTKSWSGPAIPSSITCPPVSNLLTFFLSSATVSALIAKCRAQRTTLTSLVSVLVAQNLALLYPGAEHFTGTIPFSLRRHSGHSVQDMGVYVSNVLVYYSSEPRLSRGYMSCTSDSASEKSTDDTLWESARATKAEIATAASSIKNTNIGLLKCVSDYRSFFLGMLGTKRSTAFEVTNVGVVDGGAGSHGKEGKAYFDRMIFSTALCTFGDPFCVSLVTAKDGDMCVAINWETGVVADADARALSEWLEAELGRLSREK